MVKLTTTPHSYYALAALERYFTKHNGLRIAWRMHNEQAWAVGKGTINANVNAFASNRELQCVWSSARGASSEEEHSF